ncbi:hypothetical protein CVT26_014813 [Gymnopilus dilepis]|uniref:Peptidase C14 caspase domain-containing protein n=1 Tax=Gymnopilus dilepis TaxID=231916 RepID=A0A409W9S6_9AGAR|nr:hypothetical protein CVT26_014813 [Gymnopilus dilepis]
MPSEGCSSVANSSGSPSSMAHSKPITLDLSRQKLLVKPDGPLPKQVEMFYPPPKALMVTPIYDTYEFPSPPDDDAVRSVYNPSVYTRDFAYPERRSHSHPRAVYTDSEYDDDRSYSPSHRSASHGRDYTPSVRSRRHQDDYYPPDDRQSVYTASHVYGPPRSDHSYQSLPYDDQRGRAPFIPPGMASSSSGGIPHHTTPNAVYSGGDRDLLDDVLRKYFQLLPPHRDFMWSKCTGRKRAVCIGINYTGSSDELKGCANDAKNMRQFLMDVWGFRSQDILLLVDDGRGSSSVRPTRREMFNAMSWLVKGAQAHDSLFFHYSGHGGQTDDPTGRESDGKAEVIFPVDFKQAGDIIDDDLHDTLVKPLPPGCRLTAVFDSCHSGTVLDLPYLHSAHGRLRGISHITRRARERGASPSDVICFAACKDDETSADTFHGNVATGAMSYEFIHSLRRNPHQTYEQLLEDLRARLIPKYHQKAQISGTHPIDLNRDFIL